MKMLSDITKNPAEALKIAADNMIKTRPKRDVEYITYKSSNVYKDTAPLGPRTVDLKVLYPEAANGDVVFVGTNLRAADDYEITMNTEGYIKMWLGGELFLDTTDSSEKQLRRTAVHLKKGDNKLLFMCRCRGDDFSFSFMPAVGIYYMWAKDYIAHVRALSPIEEYSVEEGVGISRLYKHEVQFDEEYVYPLPTEEKNSIDFGGIFPEESGKIAYALTYAAEDTVLRLKPQAWLKVFVNGMEKKNYDSIALKKDDSVLIKSLRSERWSVSYNSDAALYIKGIETRRAHGTQWLTLGTFSSDGNTELKSGPEIEMQFTRPYITADRQRTFWRLNSREDYIRPYIESCFYSQWFYALMVGHYGILDTAKTLNDQKYMDYFYSSMRSISRYYDYMQYEYEKFGQSTFLQKSHEPDNLDETGTMGMNLAELYTLFPDSDTLCCINRLADSVMNNVMRFPDGAFRRPDTMWADDTYMSCPFLVRLGYVYHDKKYFAECVRQFKGFAKRLYMPEKKLFSHIFFTETERKNSIPWGRANGWVINALSDVLMQLPEDTDGIDALKELYCSLAEGIRACQDENGLWHQVLDIPESYTETSCSGMFLLSLCRGIINGWIGTDYAECVNKAYNAIISNKIDADGNIYDVCMGSSRSMDAAYYMQLPPIKNDDHGTGIILSALCAYIELRKSLGLDYSE